MLRVTILMFALVSAVLVIHAFGFAADEPKAGGEGDRVFEMRTYYTHPGRLDALNKRFRDHTRRIFQKHGMESIGYWVPQDEKDVLVYILAFPSREAAKASWDAFRADPEWKEVQAASEKDGKIVKEVKSVFMGPTDYSRIK